MNFYRTLAALPWPRSFAGKIFAVCFLGTHVPLLVLLGWMAARSSLALETLAVVTAATLAGTAATLFALHHLMAPIRLAAAALEAYPADGELPELPTGYTDEAGVILRHVNDTLRAVDRHIGELAHRAMTDPLTDVRNRRWMNEIGIAMVERHRDSRRPFALLVVDLDDFKRVNDSFGHVTGDRVIAATADAIAIAIGDHDVVVRNGGDEFCVFLPDASLREAGAIAGRIANEVDAATSQLGLPRRVTVSIGTAALSVRDRGFIDLFRRADQDLYRIKRDERRVRSREAS